MIPSELRIFKAKLDKMNTVNISKTQRNKLGGLLTKKEWHPNLI